SPRPVWRHAGRGSRGRPFVMQHNQLFGGWKGVPPARNPDQLQRGVVDRPQVVRSERFGEVPEHRHLRHAQPAADVFWTGPVTSSTSAGSSSTRPAPAFFLAAIDPSSGDCYTSYLSTRVRTGPGERNHASTHVRMPHRPGGPPPARPCHARPP